MEGLRILTPGGVCEKLGELASEADLPWALIKTRVCDFANSLRGKGVFFVFTDDQPTISKFQPELRNNRDCFFTLPAGVMFVHPCDTAKKIIDAYGASEMGIMWPMAQPHLIKFLETLYSHNCFVARGDDAVAKFLISKTGEKPVSIRMKS